MNRLLNVFVILGFLTGALGVQNLHRVLHHFTDSHHTHNILCLSSALEETPADEEGFTFNSTIKVKSCGFEQAISYFPRIFQHGHILDFDSNLEILSFKVPNFFVAVRSSFQLVQHPPTGPPQIS